jgi:cell division protein FtsZ
MREYHEIIGIIQRHIHPDSDFKAGMAEIEDMDEEEIRVTVIATGLNDLRVADASPLLMREDGALPNDAVAAQNEAESPVAAAQQQDPFANFNKSMFSTPAFFRKNRS